MKLLYHVIEGNLASVNLNIHDRTFQPNPDRY